MIFYWNKSELHYFAVHWLNKVFYRSKWIAEFSKVSHSPKKNFLGAEFNEFERRLKFETRFKYVWFHLKLYSIFKILAGAQLKPFFGGFETRLNFIKFVLWFINQTVCHSKITAEVHSFSRSCDGHRNRERNNLNEGSSIDFKV